jgi:hypothetical protein
MTVKMDRIRKLGEWRRKRNAGRKERWKKGGEYKETEMFTLSTYP